MRLCLVITLERFDSPKIQRKPQKYEKEAGDKQAENVRLEEDNQ